MNQGHTGGITVNSDVGPRHVMVMMKVARGKLLPEKDANDVNLNETGWMANSEKADQRFTLISDQHMRPAAVMEAAAKREMQGEIERVNMKVNYRTFGQQDRRDFENIDMPLAIFIHSSDCNIHVAVNIILCFFFYLPAIIHALWYCFFRG
ncbi:hypothetical protein COOONC_10382 [Cooperia oncophora]